MSRKRQETLWERFCRLSMLTETSCIEWSGYCDKTGYGKISDGVEKRLAHRVAYELFIGPIPEGHHVHHRCRNRSCVNPTHLVALATREHASEHLPDLCIAGHAFTPENTRFVRGQRQCRACDARRAREYRERHPERATASRKSYYDRNAERLRQYARDRYRARTAA